MESRNYLGGLANTFLCNFYIYYQMLKKINGKFQKLGGVMTPLGTPPNSAYGYKILDKDYMILVYILISFFFFFVQVKLNLKYLI